MQASGWKGDIAVLVGIYEEKVESSWVTAKEAAAFLKIARSTVMALARTGKIPAHPVTNGRRKRWLFFISELAAYVRGLGVNCGSHPCAS
jgi:excisionase family DNA binding protein